MTIAKMVSVAALVGMVACSNSPVAPNTAPDFKVDRGNANSGTYTCTKQSSPTYKHVTADRKEALIQQGYTCTKD